MKARATAPPRWPNTKDATTVELTETEAQSVQSIAGALPDPTTLAAGTVVILPATVRAPRSLTRSVLEVLGRSKTIARAPRCTALVAAGYVDVGAARDDKMDIAWGVAPGDA